MTRSILLSSVLALVLGCGGSSATSSGAGGSSPAVDPPRDETRSELETRQNAACEALGPRLTSCAVDEARKTMSAEELAKLDLEQTAPAHTEEFITECKRQQLSSRQVRVYEVCIAEETECDPLVACLDHARPSSASPTP